MDVEDALRIAIDGNGLLFVGAGLSFLARRTDSGEAVPDTSHLVDLLLQQPPGTGSTHRLDRIAGAVVRQKGVDFVYDIIRSHFLVGAVDPKLTTLYTLPWKRIYTTNYDNAIELARTGSFPISSVTVDEPQSRAKIGSVIHLNGFVTRISPANIERGLLLTDTSYAASRLIDTGWLSFFEHDIRTSRCIIFAGYSLYDLEIDKALLSAEGLSHKTFFFISPKADAIEVSTLERYGRVTPGGIDALVESAESVKADYQVPRFVQGFTCVRELTPEELLNETRSAAQMVADQLVYGRLPERAVLAGAKVFDDQPYLVVREQDRAAQAAIRQGPWRDILFIGELASGKSASTLTLAAFLRQEGYRTYFAEHGESLKSDLQRLSDLDQKMAVIFDGYSPFRQAIAEYAARRPITHRIIMTERSAIHEFIGDFIDKTPHLGPVREIMLDRIADVDVPGFEALTNFGGFWGPRAGASLENRHRYIIRTLDGSLYRLLIEIIESEKVQAQLRELLKPLSADRAALKIFCSALIVNALGFEFTISEWQYLFDRQLVGRMLTNFAQQVRHFILNDSDHIYIRHGLLSTHILHAFTDDEVVREALTGLYEHAQRYSGDLPKWRSLRIELVKFSSIEPMFSGKNKTQNILSYYDDIRVFGGTKNNPDYWLQVGIAATVLDDLQRAKLCFDNAYARERAQRAPNLTRIDNYFSRFQMRQAVAEADPKVAFSTFIKANERLEKQIFLDINRHYPFKTGRYFSDIAARHYDAWDDKQKEQFKDAATKIREKAEEWKANKREFSPDIEILIRETTSLLRKLGPSGV